MGTSPKAAAEGVVFTETLREAIFAEDQLDPARAVELYGEAISGNVFEPLY